MAGEQRRSAAEVLGLPAMRSMPSNIEMEQAVLGTLLMHNGVWSRVSKILSRDCFYEEIHKRIFDVVSGLLEQGQTANAITCRRYLPEAEVIPGVTPAQYLARLSREAAGPSTEARGYAMFLYDMKLRRDAISVAMDMLDRAYGIDVGDTGRAITEDALSRLAALNTAPEEQKGFQPFDNASYKAIMAAQTSYQSNGALIGLSTGLPRLDDALGGLQEPDLIIIAGRPGIGKTSLVTNICFNVARHLKAKRDAGEKTGVVGFISLEMGDDQLATRVLSDQSGVPHWKIRRGKQSAEEMERFVHTQRELQRLPLEIDSTGGQSIGALRAAALALKKAHGLELLAVDYLQLLNGSARKGDANRVQELTEITSGLKALAKELRVPVLALSQLSRKVEERDDKRPMLADLRESGSIEQDADSVLFVFREEYYLRKQKVPAENTEARLTYERKLTQCEGVAEIIIGKNRHGPETVVELGFDANLTRFLNEPLPREIDVEEVRQRQPKKPSLHKDAETLMAVLRNLTLHESERPSSALHEHDRKLPRAARVIKVELARERYGEKLYGPDYDKELVEKEFRLRMKDLAAQDLAFWTGVKGDAYVWLPEQAWESAHG